MNQIELQRQAINKVLEILKSFSSISGIFLLGSHVNNSNTEFSDIDLAIVFQTDDREFKDEIFNKIAQIFQVLAKFWLYDKDALFLYENGVRLDVSFIAANNLKNWKTKKFKILFDPQNVLSKHFKANKDFIIPVELPKWNDQEGDYFEWYLWIFRQIYCWTKQAEINKEKSFNKLFSSQTSLSQVREKILEMRIYINGQLDYLNNFDPQLAEELKSTFVPLEPKEMLKATRKLLDIFCTVAKNYASKINKKYPEDKIRKMRKLLEMFDSI